jgi:EPS-associated MarR family transcriptional regulator
MIEYHIIKELENNPSHTQRSLADALHISLGKANYLLAGLAEKGIIKAKRLKNEPDKIRWRYILTPKGMKEKTGLARKFLSQRLMEYEKIQHEIQMLKSEAGSDE